MLLPLAFLAGETLFIQPRINTEVIRTAEISLEQAKKAASQSGVKMSWGKITVTRSPFWKEIHVKNLHFIPTESSQARSTTDIDEMVLTTDFMPSKGISNVTLTGILVSTSAPTPDVLKIGLLSTNMNFTGIKLDKQPSTFKSIITQANISTIDASDIRVQTSNSTTQTIAKIHLDQKNDTSSVVASDYKMDATKNPNKETIEAKTITLKNFPLLNIIADPATIQFFSLIADVPEPPISSPAHTRYQTILRNSYTQFRDHTATYLKSCIDSQGCSPLLAAIDHPKIADISGTYSSADNINFSVKHTDNHKYKTAFQLINAYADFEKIGLTDSGQTLPKSLRFTLLSDHTTETNDTNPAQSTNLSSFTLNADDHFDLTGKTEYKYDASKEISGDIKDTAFAPLLNAAFTKLEITYTDHGQIANTENQISALLSSTGDQKDNNGKKVLGNMISTFFSNNPPLRDALNLLITKPSPVTIRMTYNSKDKPATLDEIFSAMISGSPNFSATTD